MPRKNGIQVVEGVRKFIKNKNEDSEMVALNIELCEPRYVFLTAFLTKAFKLHIAKLEINEAFEKPIQTRTLK